MNNPYLIQRLEKPRNYENPFSFGGGLARGGRNKEAFDLFYKVMDFDYMGSAEFEWGAVPKALQVLNDSEELYIGEVEAVTKNGSSKPVYIISLPEIGEEVKDWIKNAAKRNHGHLKERLGFEEALENKPYARTVGWLKIEDSSYCKEPFMFFIDKQMYEDTLKLFGKSN